MAAAELSRTQKIEQTLEAKRAQGYRVESQDETQAVLLMRGRRRFLNLRGGEDVRYLLSFDEQGDASSRRIDLSD